jgi:hypothetical protein
MVGRAVELAGIIPEINKLNIIIERRIVISIRKKKEDYSFRKHQSYVKLIFHHYLVVKEIQVQS